MRRSVLSTAAFGVLFLGCSRQAQVPRDSAPNVLWVVWDTVRADRLSVYGFGKPTTPFLQEWAKTSRVYVNCLSAAPYTISSHASMFTGLLPTEHGVSNDHQRLGDHFETIAELLRRKGYQTYLFSANPLISQEHNFHQGFETEEHPWDPEYRSEAARIVSRKVPPEDRSTELSNKVREGKLWIWDIKASGELVERLVGEWLRRRDPARPFFIFVNYMEAHRPYIPPRTFRERIMSAKQIARSYEVDRSWATVWSYSFGLHEYTAEELAVIADTYDACLAELDDLFRRLIESLRSKGYLDNTVVILTADHGEHLGEHHLLGHEFSVYSPLLHVPLIISYPPRFQPGRDDRPVMNFDLFPTILELAKIAPPTDVSMKARSLLAPEANRVRLAEMLAPHWGAIQAVRTRFPAWDPSPWYRRLKAFHDGDHKFIWASDGRHELYDLRRGDLRLEDQVVGQPEVGHRIASALDEYLQRLDRSKVELGVAPSLSQEQIERLESLGYAGSSRRASKTDDDARTSATSQALPP